MAAQSPQGSNPTGSSGPPPQDLYPTSDIRFVLVEIGKLSTKVDRLITDVDKLDNKLGKVRDTLTFVRGVLWVVGGLTFLALTVAGVTARFIVFSPSP